MIHSCTRGDEHSDKKKQFIGWVVFSVIDQFPPIKIKLPADQYQEPATPHSLDTIRKDWKQCMEAGITLFEEVVNSNKKGKSLVPTFGYLDAGESYRMMVYHVEHHFRQKSRVDAANGQR